jgi:hypothetical protein
MSARWLLALLAMVMVFILTRHKPHPRPEEAATTEQTAPEPAAPEPAAQEPEPTAPPPAAEPAPAPAPPPEEKPKLEKHKKPAAPSQKKKPMRPEARVELPKTPKDIRRGQTGRLDGQDDSMTGYFAGYAYSADGGIHKVRLKRAWGELTWAMEEHPGDVREYGRGQLTSASYHGDPYSLILNLGRQVIYLRFQPLADVKTYREALSVYYGWLLSDHSDNPGIQRLALIDVNAHNRLKPPGSPGASEWPDPQVLKALTQPFGDIEQKVVNPDQTLGK